MAVWDSSTTNQLINSIGGIAGQLINDKKSGQTLTPGANQVADLATQTAAALALAQAQAQAQANQKPATNYTPLILGGGALVIVIVLFLAFKK